MEILFVLIAVSLVVALVFLGLFLFSIRTGQYDDMHTPSVRILFENNIKKETHLENGTTGTSDSNI